MRQSLLFFLILLIPLQDTTRLHAQPARKYNYFNLRNLQVQYPFPSARAGAMGGASIALAGEPTTISINPAGLAKFVFPAASLGHRLQSKRDHENGYGCGNQELDFTTHDFVNDQTMVNVIIPASGITFAVFREAVYESRTNGFFQGSGAVGSASGGVIDPWLGFPDRDVRLHQNIISNAIAAGLRLHERLSIGGSLQLVELEYQLQEAEHIVPESYLHENSCALRTALPESRYLTRTVHEKQWELSYNLGAHAKLTQTLSMGMVFTHRPSYEMRADLFLPQFQLRLPGSVPAEQFAAVADSVRFTFNLPDIFGVGFAYSRSRRFTLALDLRRTYYEEISEAARHSSRGDLRQLYQLQLADLLSTDPREVDLTSRDTWQIHLGAEYTLPLTWKIPALGYKVQSLHLRAGYFNLPDGRHWAQDFAQAEARQIFPEQGDAHVLAAGFGAVINVQNSILRLDLSLGYATDFTEILVSGALFIF